MLADETLDGMVLAPAGEFIKHNSPAVRKQPGWISGHSRAEASRSDYDFTRNVARNALRVLLLVHLPLRPSPWYDCRSV